ncbi:D-alanyl-D-alanine carboxypeptidase/D-alanyl-D-alanine endopeptidase [Rhodoferax saidenbachensis]|uniref:D-alanyl-D-alanine carboxypeptidase/D-alanyl-D-alanine-endopeptidase n=1 Tax=Rhodoferax saidenbachensis TaxID=1484693 RepID=A0A1P8KED6_9BURK|nr:D-alanyl-D-alanine carboxypeptidase/D-alanyl-D-alanine-endopeptidase [Rhodoferax saidenbachensis]APW44400.1 D-alanyl-D-alanine carboxypeptidase/D-alanyl-D-alanine-endopeptidase [Rhodoferax saidenbachensis]
MPLRFALLALITSLSLAAHAQNLPPDVETALARARVPRDAVSALVVEAGRDAQTPRLSWRANTPMNPASVMKLVTTYAALDLLGPAYTWTTPVYVEGAVRDGTLYGNLYIKGQGDPKLVLERLWLLLRRVQGLGIKTIAGDIVLDRSAFDVPDTDPSSFDGEPLRPYNAAPDALLLNYKSVVMTFTPDRGAGVAQVQFDPPLAGVQMQSTVALSVGDCGDYRGALKADFSDANRIRFLGSYPAACGEKAWPVAYAEPRSYSMRAVQGLWQDIGGKLGGSVRLGAVPSAVLAAKPAFEATSAPLAEIIRDINKYSNNVMAQQVFLTLGNGSFDGARSAVTRWWKERLGEDAPVLDNGSGLSRQERISAQALGRLLNHAYQSPVMPELMGSLPISGLDGTLRRMKSRTGASAHLKTGSLSNVVAVAGYVDGSNGRRFILVALINHANAGAARPAIEALVDWASKEQ